MSPAVLYRPSSSCLEPPCGAEHLELRVQHPVLVTLMAPGQARAAWVSPGSHWPLAGLCFHRERVTSSKLLCLIPGNLLPGRSALCSAAAEKRWVPYSFLTALGKAKHKTPTAWEQCPSWGCRVRGAVPGSPWPGFGSGVPSRSRASAPGRCGCRGAASVTSAWLHLPCSSAWRWPCSAGCSPSLAWRGPTQSPAPLLGGACVCVDVAGGLQTPSVTAGTVLGAPSPNSSCSDHVFAFACLTFLDSLCHSSPALSPPPLPSLPPFFLFFSFVSFHSVPPAWRKQPPEGTELWDPQAGGQPAEEPLGAHLAAGRLGGSVQVHATRAEGRGGRGGEQSPTCASCLPALPGERPHVPKAWPRLQHGLPCPRGWRCFPGLPCAAGGTRRAVRGG